MPSLSNCYRYRIAIVIESLIESRTLSSHYRYRVTIFIESLSLSNRYRYQNAIATELLLLSTAIESLLPSNRYSCRIAIAIAIESSPARGIHSGSGASPPIEARGAGECFREERDEHFAAVARDVTPENACERPTCHAAAKDKAVFMWSDRIVLRTLE